MVDGSKFKGREDATPRPNRRMVNQLLLGFGSAALAGCSARETPVSYPSSGVVVFDDNPKWTTRGFGDTFDGDFFKLKLLRIPQADDDTGEITLGDVAPGKKLVLVVTRGAQYGGSVCVFCATQTSRLIANYPRFVETGSQIVVIFPIVTSNDQAHGPLFRTRVFEYLTDPPDRIPFPVAFDVELKLVKALGILDQLAKPATYIFDTDGQIQFAYVGKNLADRPSVDAMLKKLSAMSAPVGKASTS